LVVIDLSRLLNPGAIAVVGASDDPRRIGGQPVHHLKSCGYTGRIYPVNPTRDHVQGLPSFPNVKAIAQPCDLAIIAVGAESVPDVVRECGEARIPYAIVLAAGFDEIGNRSAQQALSRAIRDSGVRIVGPNCTGVLNLRHNVFSGFGAGFRNPNLKRGPVAMVTQSGGFGYSVVASAEHEGVGFDAMVSTGNEIDLTALDFIEHFLEDPQVELVAVYLEGVTDGRRLRELGWRALQLGKPIAVWKVGNSRSGAKAAQSHTANLTAAYTLYQAAFREGGYVEIDEVYDLVDVVNAFKGGRLPAGRRLAVLTTSGGAGVLMADLCEQKGIELPELSPQSKATLDAMAPGLVAVQNPADLSAALTSSPERFNAATRVLLEDPNIDMAIVRSFPGADVDAWAEGLAALVREIGKPVLVSLSGLALKSEQAVQVLARAAIPCYPTPGRAVTAAAALVEFAQKIRASRRGRPVGQPGSNATAPWPVQRIELPVPQHVGGALSEHASMRCLAAYGIPTVRRATIAEAELDAGPLSDLAFPVAVKGDSPDIAHKTEAGGVRLDVRDPDALRIAAREVIASMRAYRPGARVDGVVVQEMASGVEMLAGSVDDPVFGPYVVLGMGGVLSELMADTTLRFAPFDRATALAMIDEVRGARLLRGWRGSPPADLAALADALVRLSWLAHDHAGRIAEIDINPLFVRPAGRGVVAADALVVLHDSTTQR
jgi:acyl-CoA synthetase (NDP forming)